MTTSLPHIGFDRYIKLEWAATALKARAGLTSLDELNALLASENLGKEALGKTQTKLNGLWLAPRAELRDFADRGAAILNAAPATSEVALTWGMALASYPFFAKLAEQVGRLTALQDDCSAAEVHRRMNEVYGEREITRIQCIGDRCDVISIQDARINTLEHRQVDVCGALQVGQRNGVGFAL